VYWVHITMFLGVFHMLSDDVGGIGNTNASVAGQDPIDKSHVGSYVTSYFTARLAPSCTLVLAKVSLLNHTVQTQFNI